MRRNILILLLVVSIFFVNVVPCFAYPWTATQADIVTNSIQSIDTKVGNLYTGIQSIYQLLYNSGNTITQGVQYTYNRIVNYIEPKLDTVNYYLGRLDYNSGIIMQRLIDYFAPITGDNKTIAQQLYDLRQLTAGVGNQVADVSSKLLNTNNLLSNFQSINHSDQQDILNKLSDIYNSLYYLEIKSVKNYYDYYSPTNSSTTTTLGDYPFEDTDVFMYFQPIFEISDLDENNSITIYYPYSGSFNNFSITKPSVFNLYTSTDLSRLRSYTFNYSISYNIYENYIAVTYTFIDDLLSTWVYLAPHATITTDLSLSQINGFTPYFVTSTSENKFYLEVFKNQYSELINLLNDIEHNNSFIYNDDDISIDVELDFDDGSGVSNIIKKLNDLYDTGINITSFITALNYFDNLQWFTLPVYNVVNQSTGQGYLDLYD